MKALVLEKNTQLVYKSRNDPRPEPDEYVVQVHSAGICNSDLARAFSNKAYHYPLIMGHEIAGTIVECGAATAQIRNGTPVAIFPLRPCFGCRYCNQKKWVLCQNYNYYGSRCDGGFAEYIAVKEWNIVPITNHCPLEYAALTEPVAVAIHTINAIEERCRKGHLAIIGGGFIGLCSACIAEKKGGFDSITIFDRNQFKCDLAKSWGFNAVRMSSESDEVDGHQNKYDVVVEWCGAAETYRLSLDISASEGLTIWMGNIQGDLTLSSHDVSRVLRREMTIKSVWNSNYQPNSPSDWTEALEILATDKRVHQLVTHRIPLENGANIFQDLYHVRKNYQPHHYLKVMLDIA